MTEMEIQLPDNVKEVIEEMRAFQYNSAKGFKVFICTARYNPIIQEGSLQGSVNENQKY